MDESCSIKKADRLVYIDIAKGIGIICVIIGHMNNAGVNRVVFSFHMPLFFLISGYFLSSKLSPKEVLNKRLKQLLRPYIYTCIALVFMTGIKNIIKFFAGEETLKTGIKEIIKIVYASFYGAGNSFDSPIKIISIGAIWFLLAMIWASFLTQYARTRKYPSLWIVGMAVIGIFSSKVIWLPWSIQAAMTASVFVYVGVLLKKYNAFKEGAMKLFIPSLLIWGSYIYYATPSLYIVRNHYPNGIFDFIGGVRRHIDYLGHAVLV